MNRSAQPWEAEMRASNKRANGCGWTIRQLKGRCQITMKLESGRKPSVLTEIPWQPDKSLSILNAVQEIRAFIEKGNSIQEANEMRLKALGKASGKAPALREFDWVAAADDFLKSMESRREGTLDDLRIRVRRFKLTLKSRPTPNDGPSLIRAFARLYFDEVYPPDHRKAGKLRLPPGKDGRRRNLRDVARILRHGVEEMGAPERWLPLPPKKMSGLIGSAVTETITKAKTIPVLPEDFEALLDNLEADGKLELRLAVGLVGLYGLRPSELAVMRLEDDGKLYVGGQVKRDAKAIEQGTEKPERLVKPLDLNSREGLGKELAMLWYNGRGKRKLPLAIRNEIAKVEEKNTFKEVGAAFSQLLTRYRYWKILVKKTPGLKPYGLRHGWAWRAHKNSEKQLHYSQASALLGHTTRVHLDYYSSWVSEDELEKAVEEYNQNLKSVAS
ncbi:site-specific integrase [Synechococcus sp. TAK9802]|uniref:site-specific integrase n=1 Tax=Synechococcus sp. TAK9802 TaxID=1442558 RepID=UPI001648391A|nr:site-specific integrase [Synechococcus sp. TAK9802]QNI62844.1 phage integrase family protein [Synechococcus sp. TAK9802]